MYIPPKIPCLAEAILTNAWITNLHQRINKLSQRLRLVDCNVKKQQTCKVTGPCLVEQKFDEINSQQLPDSTVQQKL
jgi:hypothetical protein